LSQGFSFVLNISANVARSALRSSGSAAAGGHDLLAVGRGTGETSSRPLVRGEAAMSSMMRMLIYESSFA
jgi:hypothetical protein